ncbi:MAG: hypothetical protein WD772_11355, partial [Pseudohongiellaceae bacterium]
MSKGSGHHRRPVKMIDRRRFLAAGATGAAATWLSSWPWQALNAQVNSINPQNNWNAGALLHLLPTVSDSRLLIKASFARPLASPPRLRLQSGSNSRMIEAQQNDTGGEFW